MALDSPRQVFISLSGALGAGRLCITYLQNCRSGPEDVPGDPHLVSKEIHVAALPEESEQPQALRRSQQVPLSKLHALELAALNLLTAG